MATTRKSLKTPTKVWKVTTTSESSILCRESKEMNKSQMGNQKATRLGGGSRVVGQSGFERMIVSRQMLLYKADAVCDRLSPFRSLV